MEQLWEASHNRSIAPQTPVLQDLQRENYPLESWQVAALSPYLTWHINRFGRYDLDMEKQPPELLYDLWA